MNKIFLYLSLLLFGNMAFAQYSHVYNVKATYYSKKFNGRRTFSGEKFHSNKYTAAHRNFPLQSLVKVTNPRNNKSVIVRINDRFYKKNYIDLSLIAAKEIDIIRQGTAKVKIQLLDASYTQMYLNQRIDSNTITPILDTAFSLNSIDITKEFYIRLSSFKFKKNAKTAIAKDLPKAYRLRASIKRTKYKNKPLYKVIIGPYSTKEEATSEKTKLSSKFKDAVIFSE
ncbi:MAG: septal ring lytic transglycosylase RlpA family protein [Bacteroidales bacterium]